MVTPGVDIYGADISCDNVDVTAAAAMCTKDNECLAISSFFINEAVWSCTKSDLEPSISDPDFCLYIKISKGQ